MPDVGVDFGVFETLLEVVVDRLVGDFADQREIRDADFLLLRRFVGRFPDLWLPTTPAAALRLCLAGISLAAGSFRDRLEGCQWCPGLHTSSLSTIPSPPLNQTVLPGSWASRLQVSSSIVTASRCHNVMRSRASQWEKRINAEGV